MEVIVEFTRSAGGAVTGSGPGPKVGVAPANILRVDPKASSFGNQNTLITLVGGIAVEVVEDYEDVVAALNA